MSKQLAISTYFYRFRHYIGSSRLRLHLFFIGVLAAIVVGLYLNSLGNDFVNWDDPGNIITNKRVRSLDWSNIKQIFTPRRASTYQPVRVLSYAIDYYIWKLKPFGYHITNMLFYLLTCVMLFLATRELLGFLRSEATFQSNMRIAFFTALLFSVHPVHVEAVTWLSGRKEVLLGFFFFGALFCYFKASKTSGRPRRTRLYSLAFVCFLIAVLSKPSAVVLPGIVLLFEVSRADRNPLSFFKRSAFWLLPTCLISVLIVYILLKVMNEAGGIYPYRGGGVLSNFLLSFYVFALNIKLIALTVNYAPVYTVILPYPILGIRLISFLCLNLGLVTVAILIFKKSRVIFFSVLWFYVTVLPFSNIIPISTLLADRYVFIPSFAFCLVLGLGFERLWCIRSRLLSEDFFLCLATLLLFTLLAGYSYMTVRQNRVWMNSFVLWTDALAKQPKSVIARNSLAVIYIRNGAYGSANELLKEAAEINPSDPMVQNNLGVVYKELGMYERSEYHYRKALSLKPSLYEPRVGLGDLFAIRNDFEKAVQIFGGLALEYPQNPLIHFRMASVLENAGKFDKAIQEYKRSIALAPNVINAYESLGRLYLEKLNDSKIALHYYRRALEMAPHSPRAEGIQALIELLEVE